MSAQDIRNWYRARPGYWFRPKLFGWGAVPVTWQGWLMTAGFVAVAYGVTYLARLEGPALLALLVPLLVGFILLCRAKTDGDWRWRSGEMD